MPVLVSVRTLRRRLAHGATALGLAALLAGCEREALAFRGIAMDPPLPAPALRLATADGGTFDLAEQRGRVVLLFFGYTRCPDICPTTLGEWARLRTALGDDAEGARFVFVSVDTARDTPRDAQAYASQFDPRFVGLVADSSVMARLTRDFSVAAYEVPGEHADHPMMAHGSQTFVVDRQGRLRVLHPPGSRPEDVRADVERLLD